MGLKRPSDVEKVVVQEIDEESEEAPEPPPPSRAAPVAPVSAQSSASAPSRPRPHKEQAVRWRFSPAAEAIDDARCYARVQMDSRVQQCSNPRAGKDWFCLKHGEGRWQILGRVDGPIPKVQLSQLLKTAAADEAASGVKVLRRASLEAMEPRERNRRLEDKEKLLDRPHEEVVSQLLKQQEDELWREVLRVHELEDSCA
ncbi:unnamed protein product [Effrenium voratum]|nr:unnamed protein product [Effrenium voratum]